MGSRREKKLRQFGRKVIMPEAVRLAGKSALSIVRRAQWWGRIGWILAACFCAAGVLAWLLK